MPEPQGSKVLVHVRLPTDLVKKIDHLAVDWGVFRGEAMERLLREALDHPDFKFLEQFDTS